jgi:hypothetical protein
MNLQEQYSSLWENDAGYVLYIEPVADHFFLVSFAPAKGRGPIARRRGGDATTARMPGRWSELDGQLRVTLSDDDDGPSLDLVYVDENDWLAPGISAPYDPRREPADVPWMKSLDYYRRVPREQWDQYVLLGNLGPLPVGFPTWSDRVLDRIEAHGVLQFYSPGGYETRANDEEKHIYLAPSVVEMVGGKGDGEEGYAFSQLDVEQLREVFDEVQGVSWDTMHDELTVEGVVVGESGCLTICKLPFEDAAARKVFDQQALRRKRRTHPELEE